jgi:maleylacetoacetate isomerase
MMKLYDYHRSGAAYRTRIALNLKGLEYEPVSVHLSRGGGEQYKPDYVALNPQKLVPSLIDGGEPMIQSMAIMEYLEETHPTPPLLPKQPIARARVRALANIVACDIHPINNLRVRNYVRDTLNGGEAGMLAWIHHWIQLGFEAYEKLVASNPQTGKFSHGDTPTMADCCLIPQIVNARGFKTPLDAYPTILKIEAACQTHPAFIKAKPENQAVTD